MRYILLALCFVSHLNHTPTADSCTEPAAVIFHFFRWYLTLSETAPFLCACQKSFALLGFLGRDSRSRTCPRHVLGAPTSGVLCCVSLRDRLDVFYLRRTTKPFDLVDWLFCVPAGRIGRFYLRRTMKPTDFVDWLFTFLDRVGRGSNNSHPTILLQKKTKRHFSTISFI